MNLAYTWIVPGLGFWFCTRHESFLIDRRVFSGGMFSGSLLSGSMFSCSLLRGGLFSSSLFSSSLFGGSLINRSLVFDVFRINSCSRLNLNC